MNGKSVGDSLRDARLEQGLQLGDLESITGIPAHHLLALELDQFALVPQESLETYLEQYAQSVGLNPNDINHQRDDQEAFQHTLTPAPKPEPRVIKPAFSEDFTDDEEQEEELLERTVHRRRRSHRDSSQKKSPWPIIILTLLALAIIVIVSYFAIKEWPFTAKQSADQTTVTTEVTTAESTTETTTVTETVETTVTNQVTDGFLTVTAQTTKETVDIVFTLTGTESWVSLSNELLGEQGTTLSNEQKEFKVAITKGSSSFVTVGIPNGVDVTVDGQKIDTSTITNNSPGNFTLVVE